MAMGVNQVDLLGYPGRILGISLEFRGGILAVSESRPPTISYQSGSGAYGPAASLGGGSYIVVVAEIS